MISIIITSFKESKTIGRAIESFILQNIKENFEMYVVSPDNETINIAKKYKKKHKQIKIFKDPGKGKLYALNLILPKLKGRIIILSDGDVYVSKNSADEILRFFKNAKIGCVSGRPVPIEGKKTKYGYWANFLFEAAHKLRKESSEKNNFIECSGYLFAFRADNKLKIPLDTAEDAMIPYYFFENGYKIGYAENAKVYVKNADNWNDWIKQKVRTAKAHETLNKYVDTKTTSRLKSFKKEALGGIKPIFYYPKNFNERIWTLELCFARLYMWLKVIFLVKFKRIGSVDNWERIESAR